MDRCPREALAGSPSSAEFVATVSGVRVTRSATSFGLRGTATVLARPRGDARTRVCLTVKSDGGVTPTGSTWRVTGASGRAAGFTGSGLIQPPAIGAPAGAAGQYPLTVRQAKRKGLPANCRALERRLAPKPKRRAKRSGKAKG